MVYCIVCDYDMKESVEDHIRKNHPLICSICEMGFGDDLDLQSHMDTYHPGIHMR